MPKPWDRVIKSCDGKVGFQFDANLRHQQVDTVIVAMVCDKNSALAPTLYAVALTGGVALI